MNKKWEYIGTDENKVKNLAQKHGISEIIARVLINRGLEEDNRVENFLHPKIENLYNPFLLNDMEKAVERIVQCKEKNEKITIDEGYGLNNIALEKISKNGTKVLITVDCGISAYDEVEYAKGLGLDVIVTDHHECPEKLPDTFAVIDPKRDDSNYPFSSLAGVGVTFKLIHAISIKLNLDRKRYLKYLDIVCLGTVADIVPLIDENRIIVNYGLMLVRQTKNIGLKALIEVSGYDYVDSTSISFGLAPRINACGRMGKAEIALKLLLTSSVEEAKLIADSLNKLNKERQDVEKRIINEAIEMIERDKLYENDIIVVGNENWHHGVIGIVSSKITDLYYKPSILISFEGDLGKGSGRSIDGFDLHEALTECSEFLDKFGGHEMAIGLSLKKQNYENFKKKLMKVTSEKIDKDAIPSIKIDAVVSAKEINYNIFDDMKLLEPYGESNPSPLFASKNLKVESVRLLSNDKHLKLTLKEDNIILNAIGFNLGNRQIHLGDKVDLVYALELNKFNNVESIQLNVKDIKRSLN